jgi:hypothetical protein
MTSPPVAGLARGLDAVDGEARLPGRDERGSHLATRGAVIILHATLFVMYGERNTYSHIHRVARRELDCPQHLLLRGVWIFRDRSPGKDGRFPFRLSKDGSENSKRIVAPHRRRNRPAGRASAAARLAMGANLISFSRAPCISRL